MSTATTAHPTLLRGGVHPLLFPSSVVLVGASTSNVEVVKNVMRGCTSAWGVNPKRSEVGGLRCYPAIAELPERPELAVLMLGHQRLEQAFDEAVAAGIRSFVIPGLGNESGSEGVPVAKRLAERLRETASAAIGPNCMGVAVPGSPCSWIGTLEPSFIPGHVSTVVQSGSIGEAMVALGPRIGYRTVISSGSEFSRDVADLCAFFAQDDGTRAVGLFLETVRRPPAFALALQALAAAGKPVVCCKVGRSQAAARAVLAHSGALVGSVRAFSAMLRRYGVIEVDDFPQLVETLEVLGRKTWPRGKRIGGVSNSGGEAALLADHAEAAGIPFAPLSPDLVGRLRAEFPNYLAPDNPVDAWAIDDAEKVFPRTLEILASSGEFDILVSQVDQSQFLGKHEAANSVMITRALADSVKGTGVFPASTSVQTSDPTAEMFALAKERDIALLRGSRHAARALAAVAGWKRPRPQAADEALPLRAAAPRYRAPQVSHLLRPGAMPEYESSQVLEIYGVKLAPRRRAANPEEAARAAGELGFPVAVKVDGPAHKSRGGGVILGVDSAAAAEAAAARLGGPVLVARQLPPGPEAICGLSRDPDYGPVLAVGLGGTAVEVLALAAVALAPLDLDAARELVDSAPGLGAVAGVAARDDLARTLVALGRLAVDHPEVVEADVNPLILARDGAVAVDALLVLEGEPG